MIKKLQLKMIGIIMGVLLLVFAVLFATINILMQDMSRKQVNGLLQMIAEEGDFPRRTPDGQNLIEPADNGQAGIQPEKKGMAFQPGGHFFYVKLDRNEQAIDVRLDMIYDFSETKALEYAREALQKGNERGSLDQLQYLVADKAYGKIIVFAERGNELQMLEQLLYISLLVAGGTSVFLLGFSVLFSFWAVKPVKRAFEKQRQFVADASHELKTPLTIISANADVLQNEIGENIRVQHIKSQTVRMNSLIRSLLLLAKTGEGEAEAILSPFDLSKLVLQTVLEFEVRAFESGRDFSYEVPDGVMLRADQNQIQQVLLVLLDNAIKYSESKGKISLSLSEANGKVKLSVYNTGRKLSQEEQERIFDRFYRTDVSRSRETGGYGLGLAIAHAIVSRHKGKLTAANHLDGVMFTVVLRSYKTE